MGVEAVGRAAMEVIAHGPDLRSLLPVPVHEVVPDSGQQHGRYPILRHRPSLRFQVYAV
ncbi:hypothetical protein OG204_04720 [Streptomyces sp. NBC_01387]|uniref:hypothetical protein n=1 Tax=unclassified Streptomyces TaxID=2593676 RepID=UPI00202481C4|nr:MULTISPECIES: hypothetical protein [unclassified Streptomyces]WSC23764.1 hypothetical protein OIE60_31130 [Streptomyces sp. NBC_01766]